MWSPVWAKVRAWPRTDDLLTGVKIMHLSLASSILITGR